MLLVSASAAGCCCCGHCRRRERERERVWREAVSGKGHVAAGDWAGPHEARIWFAFGGSAEGVTHPPHQPRRHLVGPRVSVTVVRCWIWAAMGRM